MAEEEGAEEQRLLQYVLAASGLGMWDWEPGTDRLVMSRRMRLMLGYEGEDEPTTLAELHERVHPEDRAALEQSLGDHLAARIPGHRATYRVRHGDGRWIWLEERGLVVERDSTGGPRRVVATCDDVTDRVSAQQSTEWLALHDSQTGLPNRVLFRRALRRAIDFADRRYLGVGLLVMDLDRYKLVNDHHGHAAGDRLLAHVARRLRGSVRRTDIVARIGGDEFAALVVQQHGDRGMAVVAERVLARLRVPFAVGGQRVVVTASAGVATHSPGIDDEQLLARADRAMYAAKRSGRGTWRLYQPLAATGTGR